MDEDKYYCEVYGKLLENYDPQFCCNSFDCGCRGLPTNPSVCSEKCWDKMLGQNVK